MVSLLSRWMPRSAAVAVGLLVGILLLFTVLGLIGATVAA